MWNTFKNWFMKWSMTPEDRYLSKSTDHADFEARLKVIERTGYRQAI